MRKHSRKKVLRQPVNLSGFEPTAAYTGQLMQTDIKIDQSIPALFTGDDENMVDSQKGNNTSFENIKRQLQFRTFQTSGRAGEIFHHNSDELIVQVMDNQSGTYRVSPQGKIHKPEKLEITIPLGQDYSPNVSEFDEAEVQVEGENILETDNSPTIKRKQKFTGDDEELDFLLETLKDQKNKNQELIDKNCQLISECQKKAALLQYSQHILQITANQSNKLNEMAQLKIKDIRSKLPNYENDSIPSSVLQDSKLTQIEKLLMQVSKQIMIQIDQMNQSVKTGMLNMLSSDFKQQKNKMDQLIEQLVNENKFLHQQHKTNSEPKTEKERPKIDKQLEQLKNYMHVLKRKFSSDEFLINYSITETNGNDDGSYNTLDQKELEQLLRQVELLNEQMLRKLGKKQVRFSMDYDKDKSKRLSPLFKDVSVSQSDNEGHRLRLVTSIMKRLQHIEKEFQMHKVTHQNVKTLLAQSLDQLQRQFNYCLSDFAAKPRLKMPLGYTVETSVALECQARQPQYNCCNKHRGINRSKSVLSDFCQD